MISAKLQQCLHALSLAHFYPFRLYIKVQLLGVYHQLPSLQIGTLPILLIIGPQTQL